MILRILASVLLLLSIFFMPFWISVVLAFVLMIYFHYFWEGVLIFFISDLFYGLKTDRFWGIYFISLFVSFVVLIFIETLKNKIRISR